METNEAAGPIGGAAPALPADDMRPRERRHCAGAPADLTAVSLVAPGASGVRAALMRHGHEDAAGPLARPADRQDGHHAERVGALALAEGTSDVLLVHEGPRAGSRSIHDDFLLHPAPG